MCFQCGVYGHRKEGCPLLQSEQYALNNEEAFPHLMSKPSNADTSPVPRRPNINPEVVDNFGPWKLAGKKNRGIDMRRVGRDTRILLNGG